jgi:hypothetical protein
VDRGLLGARRGVAKDGADHARARAHVAPDHHVLEGGEVREEADVLERARDAELGDAVRRDVAQRLALEVEAALRPAGRAR